VRVPPAPLSKANTAFPEGEFVMVNTEPAEVEWEFDDDATAIEEVSRRNGRTERSAYGLLDVFTSHEVLLTY
jgi:hypothetical protein